MTSFYRDHRGQTLFDFLLGVTLFLGVVAFTVAFVPDLIDPFEPSVDASSGLADRGADHLTQNVMRAEGEDQYILDTACTVALFSGNAVEECPVDHNELGKIVGVRNESESRVKIVNDDENTISLNSVQMEYGDKFSERSGDVYIATRIVTLNKQRYTLIYKVW